MKMDKILMAWYSETFSEGSKKEKLYGELSSKTLHELIDEFDKVYPKGEGPITDQARYDVIMGVIADKLSLVPREILIDLLMELMGGVHSRVDELEFQFKNHRHNLEKTYGEKPVW